MAWELAPSLARCREEANRLAPHRSKASDGTIGDAAHSARTSDHNVGARDRVHALDLTNDPTHGFDAHARVEALRVAQDRRVKYVISNKRIASFDKGWAWRPYTGANPHDKHAHISIHSTVAAETDTRPWWPAVTPAPKPPERKPAMVRQYLASLVAPNGGTWHLQADGGIITDSDGAGSPVAPYFGSAPEVGGLGATRAKTLLPYKGGYRIVVQHPDETVTNFHFPAK